MTQLFKVDSTITNFTGAPYYSQLYFSKLPGILPESATAHVHAFWNSYKAYMYDSCTVTVEPLVYVIDLDTGATVDAVMTDPEDTVAGSDGGAALPTFTQGLARFSTGVWFAGRQLKGRMFLPGITENNNDSGVPAGGYVTAVSEYIATLATPTLSVIPVVYSRTHHVAAPMQGGSLWGKWATLRSRRD
jgi:hypothetical protein